MPVARSIADFGHLVARCHESPQGSVARLRCPVRRSTSRARGRRRYPRRARLDRQRVGTRFRARHPQGRPSRQRYQHRRSATGSSSTTPRSDLRRSEQSLGTATRQRPKGAVPARHQCVPNRPRRRRYDHPGQPDPSEGRAMGPRPALTRRQLSASGGTIARLRQDRSSGGSVPRRRRNRRRPPVRGST